MKEKAVEEVCELESLKDCSYWEPEQERDAPFSSWMLADWHENGRIVACAGMGEDVAANSYIGERLDGILQSGDRIGQLLEQNPDCVGFAPFAKTWWFILPHLYLSTGYLLFVRLPMPSETVVSLVKSGRMGEQVAAMSALPADALPAAEALQEQCLAAWRAVLACLPRADEEISGGLRGQETLREAYRILGAVAAFTGLRLHRTVTEENWCKLCRRIMEEDAVGDLSLYSAVILLLSEMLARCGAEEWTVKPEQSEEGVIFSFKASVTRDGALIRVSPELAAARALAERNRLLFDGTVRGKSFRGHLCVARKDFALLGIKDDPDREIPSDIL